MHQNVRRMKGRFYLQALVALCIVIPTGAFLINTAERRDNVQRESKLRVEGMVDVLQEHALKVMETQELVLDLVEDIIRDTPGPQLPNPDTSARLAGLEQRLPQTVSVWIADAAGDIIAGSTPWPPGLNVAAFEYFQVQREEDRRGFVSRRFTGRMTGLPSFAMSRRRTAPDGSFAGTIHVAINPLYFEDYFGRVNRGVPGAAALFRADGAILARYPAQPLLGQLSAGSPVMRAMAEEPFGGVIDGTSSLDGVRRIYAYRRLGEFEVYVGYGMNMPAVLAAWQRETMLRGIGTFIVILILCGIIWLISRSLAERQAALTRLREESALRQAAQERLHEARSHEALGRMASGVAHDVNNLLTVVIGNLETLDQHCADRAAQKALDGARRAAEAGAALATSLLAYARTQVLQVETLATARFLTDTVPLLRDIATSARELALVVEPDLPDCRADRAQLQASLANLVSNARDATAPGGVITVTAHRVALDADQLSGNPTAAPGVFVAIAVMDSGLGMTHDVQARAFEPFFTTKADGSGAGLGLSQVFGVVRQLRGHVMITSAPGAGTTVTLCLPVAAREAGPVMERAAGATQSATTAAASSGVRVLVVDDQVEVRRVVETHLRRAGFLTLAAASGEEAQRLLEEEPAVDLVVSDVVMPGGLDGAGLVKRLRKAHPRLRFVLMSGYAPTLDGLVDLDVEVVRKPFSRKVLLEAVERALAQPRDVLA